MVGSWLLLVVVGGFCLLLVVVGCLSVGFLVEWLVGEWVVFLGGGTMQYSLGFTQPGRAWHRTTFFLTSKQSG